MLKCTWNVYQPSGQAFTMQITKGSKLVFLDISHWYTVLQLANNSTSNYVGHQMITTMQFNVLLVVATGKKKTEGKTERWARFKTANSNIVSLKRISWVLLPDFNSSWTARRQTCCYLLCFYFTPYPILFALFVIFFFLPYTVCDI